MNSFETALRNLLPDFKLSDALPTEDITNLSYFGTKQNTAKTYRTSDGTLIQDSGIRHFYVSSVMYKNNPTMESFRYMIIWTFATARQYRCKYFNKVELNKIFISGKTDELLLENLQRAIAKGTI
jgi:hypothetical protein